ncbi:MAG: NAD-dependent epimerase/dehydratase family protein [Terracidiphilus sp.]
MITILGAGGVTSNEVAKLLAARKQPFRLVGRHPVSMPGAAEVMAADLYDKEQTLRAVEGSSLVYMLAGLKYDHKLWAEMWPRIMANTIEACKRAGAKLIFFDNVYMYGKVNGPMTEEMPFNPTSRKGEVRAKIASSLVDAWKTGSLTAMIARSADFYGPGAQYGIPNTLVFEPFSKNQRASWLVNDSLPHSYTYTLDAAQGLVALAESPSAWNQTWHLPTTASAPTGREFIALAAKEMGVAPKYRVLNRPMVRVVGWFDPVVGEVYEMLYQNDSPYIFDSSKFAKAYGFAGTPYAEGIRVTAASYKKVI